MLEDVSVELEPLSDEEYAQNRIRVLNEMLESSRAAHAFSEGYLEIPLR